MYRLYKAVELGNLEQIAYLIDIEGEDVNSKAASFEGFDSFTSVEHFYDFFYKHTPLSIAILQEDLAATRLLLDKGAATEDINPTGQSALQLIFQYSNYNEVFEKILAAVLVKVSDLASFPLEKIINYLKKSFDFTFYKKLESFSLLGCCEAILRKDYHILWNLLPHFKLTPEKFNKYLQLTKPTLDPNRKLACYQLLDDLFVSKHYSKEEIAKFKQVIELYCQKEKEKTKEEEIELLQQKVKQLELDKRNLQNELRQLREQKDKNHDPESLKLLNFFSTT